MNNKKYQVLEHTADLKIRAYGKDLVQLFKNIMIGMFESAGPEIIEKKITNREIKLKSANLESMFVDFLSEVLYLSDVNDEAYFEVDFKKLTPSKLEATLKGQKVKSFEKEIKAVTWHDLEIKETAKGFEAIVIFDI